MKSLVFKYKSPAYFSLFIANCLIPFLLLIARGSYDLKDYGAVFNALGNTISGSVSVGVVVASALFLIYLFMFLGYLRSSILKNKSAAYVLKDVKQNSKRFWIGVTCSFVSWNIAVLFMIIYFLNSSLSSDIALKSCNYVAVGVTFILGIIANVFLSMFEYKWNFDVYYQRYKDSMIEKYIAENTHTSANS